MSDVAPVALDLAEGLALLHAVIDRAAADTGVRVLMIKGQVLELQGVREPQLSADVDVLVEPAGRERLRARVEELGWRDDNFYDTPHIVPLHSYTFRHPRWPCELDLHGWFPGFLADPAAVFDVLWARRTTVSIAHRPIPTLDVVGHAALAALNHLREGGSVVHRTHLERLAVIVDDTWSATQRAEIAALAADTGASDTLAPFLARIGAPDVAPTRPLVTPLADWQLLAGTQTTEVLPWLVGLGRTPWHRRPAFVWRAIWLGDEQFHQWDPSLAPSRRAVLAARWRRLRRAVLKLPLAWAEYRRLRSTRHE